MRAIEWVRVGGSNHLCLNIIRMVVMCAWIKKGCEKNEVPTVGML